MFAELLQADGWSSIYIGARSPISAAAEFMASQRVELVAISVTVAMHLTSVVALIRAIRKRSSSRPPYILLGGAALASDPSLRKTLGADAYASSISEGLELANQLVAQKTA
jgi:methanogenic corrinoid protein MtbC1